MHRLDQADVHLEEQQEAGKGSERETAGGQGGYPGTPLHLILTVYV